jgi:hypothetical protein
MFPRPAHPRTPAHGWLSTLRHGLDLIVAFATLRDVNTSPEAGWRDADGPFPCTSPTCPVVAVPPATVAAKQLHAGRPARPVVARTAASAATDPARDSSPAAAGAPAQPVHPHRRPLSRSSRTRRPGSVRPEPQLCLTPIAARRTRPAPAPARGARH